MAATAQNSIGRDINGTPDYTLQTKNVIRYNTILSAGVAQNFTVPTEFNQWKAFFSFEPGAAVWFSNTATAAVPAGAFASTSSELNPAGRIVNGGDTMSFITNTATAEVGVILYAQP